MKNYPLLLFFLFIVGALTACQKNNTNSAAYYITFDFDGTPIEYHSNLYQISAASAVDVMIGSTLIEANSSTTNLANVIINMNRDSVTYRDLQALIGQPLPVCPSSTIYCNIPAHINVRYDDGTTTWSSNESNNMAPTHSLTITAVERSSVVDPVSGQLIVITGTFDLMLGTPNNGMTKAARNGKFRVLFPEFL